MLIEGKTLEHWVRNFYGYGSWNARIWFIGYEEGGGDLPEEVAEKFNYFFQAHPDTNKPTLCNIRELYRRVSVQEERSKAGLFNNLYEYRFGENAVLHGLWKNLIGFVSGFRDREIPDLITYQKNLFASSAGHEAWMQLYPLPSTHNHAWYYSWLDLPQFGFLKSRSLYEDHMYQERITQILHNISVYKPEVVLMYGMNNINILKKSIQDVFQDAKFKTVKGTQLLIPQHHWANIAGTLILITTQVPTLKHNRIETGYDWRELGKQIKM